MNSTQTFTLPASYQAQFNRLLAHQQAIEAELAKRSLQDLPIEKLFRLSDLVSRQLQRLLKAAVPVSNQIKANQASSGVEAAILAAGQGGFQPPVPADSQSTQNKVIQASAPNTAATPSASLVETGSTPSPSLSATSSSTQIKTVQASGEITTTDALSSTFKVQSSAFEVQGSAPSTLNSPPSTPQEHCLMCGDPLPPLLPNGQRPDRYCQCGNPMPGAPGTSLREHCPHCDAVQPVHGYNAIRRDNRCWKCWRDLPPLDPKSPTRWLPPTRPVPSALK